MTAAKLPNCLYWGVPAAVGLLFSLPCGAQTQPPASPASAPSDYAKRQADSPFRWIMINGANADKKKPATTKQAPAGKDPAVAASAPGRQRPLPTLAERVEVPALAPANARAGVAPEVVPATPSVTQDAPSAPLAIAAAQAPASAAVEPTPLRLVKRLLPEPPDRLISADAEDRVLVQFTVQPDGSVSSVKIASSTNTRLNSHVLGAVEQWRYAAIDSPRASQAGFVFRR